MLWNVKTGSIIKTFASHTGAIGKIKLISGTNMLVTLGRGGPCKLWDLSSYNLVNTYYYWKSSNAFGVLDDYVYAMGFSDSITIISLKPE